MIRIEDVHKDYLMGNTVVKALNGVSLNIEPEEFISIMGPSGSGKSTLMNIIGILDRPTTGKYYLEGEDVSGMTRNQLAVIRNRKIGFIFQTFNLLPKKTALQNVELPLVYAGVPRKKRREQAEEFLDRVGLKDRMKHKPNELSGGQRQRVAIARALVTNPSFIFADEPTGNLDSETSVEIMEILTDLNRKERVTVFVVTHEPDIAAYADRIIHIKDGLIFSDERVQINEPAL